MKRSDIPDYVYDTYDDARKTLLAISEPLARLLRWDQGMINSVIQTCNDELEKAEITSRYAWDDELNTLIVIGEFDGPSTFMRIPDKDA